MRTTLADLIIILKRLAEAYGQTITDDQTRAYHLVLGGYPRMVLVTTTAKAMREFTFFPRPAELVKIADKINANYSLPDWAKVDEAAQWYMFRHNMTSTDELTEEDVDAIYREANVARVEPMAVPA